MPGTSVVEVPQWQGSSSSRAHRLPAGARLLADLVGARHRTRVEVAADPGMTALAANLARTQAALRGVPAGFTVTTGGDCGVELAPIADAARRYGDRLAVVWFGAHADLNTPASSPSGAFHGMVLRTLLGEGPPRLVPDRPLRPAQIVLAGVRALDPAERAYVAMAGIPVVGDPSALVEAVAGAGAVYVHIDLDVLDPGAFGSVGVPVPGGLTVDRLTAMVAALAEHHEVAGLGITEYEPAAPGDQATLARLVPELVGLCRMSVVRQIERRAVAAWPAEFAEEHAGWLLRHTPAVHRRRSNSAVPPFTFTGGDGLENSFETVEAFYGARDLPVLVQLGPAQHGELDAFLAARGYRLHAPAEVLSAFTTDVIAATVAEGTELAERPDAWTRVFVELDEHEDSVPVCEKVIPRIGAPAAFVTVPDGGRPAGMGLFAADAGWAGAFAMATRPDRRGQGIAAAVLGAGARWAARHGAYRMYLLVLRDNAPARALYARTGFTWSHDYHYRVGVH
jgi:arginase family enzyme/GNAT superfamily N-acetyltransferase